MEHAPEVTRYVEQVHLERCSVSRPLFVLRYIGRWFVTRSMVERREAWR